LKYYPVCLNLVRQNVLIAGAGQVAERKIKALLKFKPRLKVVSPLAVPAIIQLARNRKLDWLKRKYQTSDLNQVVLVVAATSDRATNGKISRDAKKKKILVNVVDESRLSNFISPAVFQKGKVIVAVSTDGREPKLSRDLKNFIKEYWDEFLSFRRRG